MAKRREASGFVYFIRAGDGPIKIGWALDPIARLKKLQVGNPEPLRLLMTLADGGTLESELHRRFAHLRLRGEWFRAEEELAGLLWLPGLHPPPPKPKTAMWGFEHLRSSDINEIRSTDDPNVAEELMLERIGIRVMQNRRWESSLSTPAA